MFQNFFQTQPLPAIQMHGVFDMKIVLLSFLVAILASYLAFDLAVRIHDKKNTRISSLFWMVGGSVVMGAGIWSMHFIGMQAFKMPMAMELNSTLTCASLGIAILASALALYLFGKSSIATTSIIGGVILGFAIASMHYVGMDAMKDSMSIHYIPSIFILSIVIAVVSSELAIWMAIKSQQGDVKNRVKRKVYSALIMGAAICGMHYTGMAAAIFTPLLTPAPITVHFIDQQNLTFLVIMAAFGILAIGFIATTVKEISTTQEIRTARRNGMLEITSSILHNVGNVLNSVNVSAATVTEKISQSELAGLIDLNNLLAKHRDNFSQFILEDPTGKELPEYIRVLAEYWKSEQTALVAELSVLIHHIQHIKDIIATQQNISGMSGYEELVDIADIIDEAISVSNLEFSQYKISVKKSYEPTRPVLVDKIKLLQVLINLIQNAKHALASHSNADKCISINVGLTKNGTFTICVSDNGIGISDDNLARIFTYGFTTKQNGHGFGLHASILAARSMQGSLNVHSDGIGKGASFTLDLPYRVADKSNNLKKATHSNTETHKETRYAE